MEWKDVPQEVKNNMEFLGNFRPVSDNSKIKGWMADDESPGVVKVYLDSSDLRDLSQSFKYVADWLDENQVIQSKDV